MTVERTESRQEPTKWQGTVLDALASQEPRGVAYVGNGEVYAVASKSDPTEFYYVFSFEYQGERLKVCNCKGFRFRDRCSHIGEVP